MGIFWVNPGEGSGEDLVLLSSYLALGVLNESSLAILTASEGYYHLLCTDGERRLRC